jgi:hypothetical protein
MRNATTSKKIKVNLIDDSYQGDKPNYSLKNLFRFGLFTDDSCKRLSKYKKIIYLLF